MISRKWKNIFINWSIEFLPIFVFFVLIWIAGDSLREFVYATGIFTVLTIISLLVAYMREERVAIFAGLSGAFIIVFGIATVYFNMPWIFMFEATAYNAAFAVILLPGLLRGKGYLKLFFTSLFDLSERGWFLLSLHYFVLFIVIAVVNEIVWRNFSQEVWVINKYVASIATIGLGFCEIPLGKKHRSPDASGWGVRVTSAADRTYADDRV